MTTERPDLYAVLEVEPNATPVEISDAYRTLLRRHHPDTRGTLDEPHSTRSDATLQRVLAAYTVLRDPVLRAEYDRQTKPSAHPARRQPPAAPNSNARYGQPPIIAGPVRWHPSR
jgi:curved DNA-binding protein CbpA